LSRRRFWLRIAWGVFVVGLVAVGFGPSLRFLGYWPRHHPQVTMQWDIVRLAADRRSVEIRVDECGADYAGTTVTRVGDDVDLMVSTREDDDDGKVACVAFDRMPKHVVHFGFVLPPDGRVIASGCPKTECGASATT
jgi:hypothetical protein